jgi:arylsulfatase A-like enzyme
VKLLTRTYGDLFPRGIQHSHGKLDFVLEHAIDKIVELSKTAPRPYLGYIHLYPPHWPYSSRREFIGRFNDDWVVDGKPHHFFTKGTPDSDQVRLRQEYDEHIAYTDAEFGRLYDLLVQSGATEDSYIVVTSDHGELFERGVWEHQTPLLYESLIHIPLITSEPNQQRREDVYELTSCVDLLPTLLQVTSQDIPDWCEGEILPGFGNQRHSSERSVYAVEAKSNPRHMPLTKATIALIKGQYKLIHYIGYDGYEDEYELYDLESDAEELHDLYEREGMLSATLREALADRLEVVNRGY